MFFGDHRAAGRGTAAPVRRFDLGRHRRDQQVRRASGGRIHRRFELLPPEYPGPRDQFRKRELRLGDGHSGARRAGNLHPALAEGGGRSPDRVYHVRPGTGLSDSGRRRPGAGVPAGTAREPRPGPESGRCGERPAAAGRRPCGSRSRPDSPVRASGDRPAGRPCGRCRGRCPGAGCRSGARAGRPGSRRTAEATEGAHSG